MIPFRNTTAFDGYKNSPLAPTPQEGLQGVEPLLPGTVIDFQQAEIQFPFDGGADTATPADSTSSLSIPVAAGNMQRIIYFYSYTAPVSSIFKVSLSIKNVLLGSIPIPSYNAIPSDTVNTGANSPISSLVGSAGFTVATATVSGVIPIKGQWVYIQGVTVTGTNTYNGLFQVTGNAFNTFTYSMPGTATNQPSAPGTYTIVGPGVFGFSLLTIPTQTKAGTNPVGYPAATFAPVNPFTGSSNEQTSLLLNPLILNANIDKITASLSAKYANGGSTTVTQFRMYLACASLAY